MRRKIATRLLPVFAVAAVLGAGNGDTPALAATDTANLTVMATVNGVCDVAAATLDFGVYDPAAADRETTTTINLTCTPGTPYDLGLGAGGGSSVTTRRMVNGTATLNYEIYSDANRLDNWGETVGTDTVSGNGTGSHTVYGRIPAGQFVDTGNYTDTVIITVTF